MSLAPIDIAQKTFGRKIYGLDTEEVYEFLRDLADEMEALNREVSQLRSKEKQTESAIDEYKDREEALKKTLHTASQMSDRMQEEAQRKGDLIIREARQRADVIIKEARESLRSMYQDINDLKKSRLQFEAGLKSLVKAHLAMIEQGHSVVPDPEIETQLSGTDKPAEPEL